MEGGGKHPPPSATTRQKSPVLIGLIKMSPPSLSKFDVEDGVKLVAIVTMSYFTKDYLIKQKIIPNNI